MDDRTERIAKAAEFITGRLAGRSPKVAIILGSGLGNLAEMIEDRITIPYSEIPCFPVSTVIGHKGNFISGLLGGRQVIAMQGRFHYYEGYYDMATLTLPVRVLRKLGVEYLFVSNAAGAANPEYHVGDMVIIKDHINLMPNPLIGPNMEEFGPRFPDMTCAYDLSLQDKALEIAGKLGLKLHRGVYLGSSGPTYETPAEVRMLATLGADAVGMSTVPEVIAAKHAGIEVSGISFISNKAAGLSANPLSHEEVSENAAKAEKLFSAFMKRFISLVLEDK